jgi:hypothetical protein
MVLHLLISLDLGSPPSYMVLEGKKREGEPLPFVGTIQPVLSPSAERWQQLKETAYTCQQLVDCLSSG